MKEAVEDFKATRWENGRGREGLVDTMKAHNFTACGGEMCGNRDFCRLRARISAAPIHRAKSLDELNENLREVVEMLLEDGEPVTRSRVCWYAVNNARLIWEKSRS